MTKRPPSGNDDPKASGSSKPEKAKPAPNTQKKRDTLVSLRAHIDDISSRLKQADTLTQQSVDSLQIAFGVLEKRVSEDGHINKAALTRRVDQLSEHLTGLIRNTQQAVAKDLRAAMANPTIEKLSAAVDIAEARMSHAETTQAAALTKVNRHIAMLAKAIDARLLAESQAHQTSIQQVHTALKTTQSETGAKIKHVEEASAVAIRDLGKRVVNLSQDLNQRTSETTKSINEKISGIAIRTQRDFQEYKTKLERRIENIEETQRNLDSYTDRSIAGLTARIDSLEYGMTTIAPPPSQAHYHPASGQPPIEELIDDPFAPDPAPQDQAPMELTVAAPAPHPAQPLTLVPPVTAMPAPAPAPHVPAPAPYSAPVVPFAPQEYRPDSQQTAAQATAYEPYVPTAGATPAMTDGSFAYTDAAPLHDSSPQPYIPPTLADTIKPEDLPYEDPAYAEHDSETDILRPGSFKTLKKRSGSKPKINPRHLRAAGIAIAAVTVGYFALRGFMGGTDRTDQSTGLFVEENVGGTMTAPVQSAEFMPDASLPAIGDYQDNQGAPIAAEPGTLEAAAQSGDPVAEFQLGLSRLQSGQTEEAITLIRASANKGQAAAQYRLAKLYETGEGVTADPAMARQLTERAARSGNRIAMHDLALYYAEGRGDVSVDIKTAAQWFEKAAQRGVVDSQYNLGVLYESGQGLPKNLTEAYVWYSVAAGQGDQFARQRIDILKDQLGEADLAKADARIKDFKPVPIDETANGIFRNVAWAAPDTDKRESTLVKETQTLLGQLGFDAGTPDGSMGPRTRTAIVNFQKSNGLDATGEVDQALVIQLQRAAGA